MQQVGILSEAVQSRASYAPMTVEMCEPSKFDYDDSSEADDPLKLERR